MSDAEILGYMPATQSFGALTYAGFMRRMTTDHRMAFREPLATAWEIAEQAAADFGGQPVVVEFGADCMPGEIIRKPEPATRRSTPHALNFEPYPEIRPDKSDGRFPDSNSIRYHSSVGCHPTRDVEAAEPLEPWRTRLLPGALPLMR